MKNASQSKGRPRREESRESILSSAFEILMTTGYESMSIEAVARSAQVGKATIYRWWRSRAHLAIEAFFERTKSMIDFPDTGSIEEDFRAQVHLVGDLLRGEEGKVLLSLVMGAKFDADLRAELFQSWIKPRKVWGEARMTRLNPKDVGVALNSLYGPLYATLLFGMQPLSVAEIDLHLDHFFRGFGTTKEE